MCVCVCVCVRTCVMCIKWSFISPVLCVFCEMFLSQENGNRESSLLCAFQTVTFSAWHHAAVKTQEAAQDASPV